MSPLAFVAVVLSATFSVVGVVVALTALSSVFAWLASPADVSAVF